MEASEFATDPGSGKKRFVVMIQGDKGRKIAISAWGVSEAEAIKSAETQGRTRAGFEKAKATKIRLAGAEHKGQWKDLGGGKLGLGLLGGIAATAIGADLTLGGAEGLGAKGKRAKGKVIGKLKDSGILTPKPKGPGIVSRVGSAVGTVASTVALTRSRRLRDLKRKRTKSQVGLGRRKAIRSASR
jgi:hypothetical protein